MRPRPPKRCRHRLPLKAGPEDWVGWMPASLRGARVSTVSARWGPGFARLQSCVPKTCPEWTMANRMKPTRWLTGPSSTTSTPWPRYQSPLQFVVLFRQETQKNHFAIWHRLWKWLISLRRQHGKMTVWVETKGLHNWIEHIHSWNIYILPTHVTVASYRIKNFSYEWKELQTCPSFPCRKKEAKEEALISRKLS